MRLVRARDEQAAVEVVRRYEPAIRAYVRARLNARLRRQFDSVDVCQLVLASFFPRAAEGEYEWMESPDQLMKWLVKMASNKLNKQVRHALAEKRDVRHQEAIPDKWEVAADCPTPSREATRRELLREVHRRLSEPERRLLELRGAGRSWAEIAAELGGTSQALRKQWQRLQERIALELGLSEAPDG